MKKEYGGIEYEPAHSGKNFRPDPSEYTADTTDGRQDEIAGIRDSVLNEPAVTGKTDAAFLGDWIEKKRSACSLPGNIGITIAVAFIGGPFAILGAFMAGKSAWYASLYIILFGPIIEEILKQSGMIYLLESRPYRVFARWQFVFCAAVSALIFATIENLLYIYVYVPQEMLNNPEMFAKFRWTVCTSVHLSCSIIASMGMIKVWNKQLADGKVADLSVAFRYFAIAIGIHGAYNLTALLLSNKYFITK